MDINMLLAAVLSFAAGMYCIETDGGFERAGARCVGVSLLVASAFQYGFHSGAGALDALWLVGLVFDSAYVFFFLFVGAIVRKRVLAPT